MFSRLIKLALVKVSLCGEKSSTCHVMFQIIVNFAESVRVECLGQCHNISNKKCYAEGT